MDSHLSPADHLSQRPCRALHSAEVKILEAQGNWAADWGAVQVAEGFDPRRVRRCGFAGQVRIGRWTDDTVALGHLRRPAGLFDSFIDACAIGDDVLIDGVRHASCLVAHDRAVLFDIGEISCTGRAEAFRIEVWNESGGRWIMPFEGMLIGDAWLWARKRGDAALMARLEAMSRREPLQASIAGPGAIVRHVHRAVDVSIGASAEVCGALSLRNVRVQSRAEAPVAIGEGVEMENAVIGEGCSVRSGAKVFNTLLCPHTTVQLGARVVHCAIGGNSQIYCAELLHSLIFPFHVQHHNNSFLIAACIEGQSNVAAGATIGSNHNSRKPDGEIMARRGFWPGLCASLKHNSRFASFTLLAKGAYPAELDLRLPYSLLSNDEARGRLLVMPAYWALYNFYALARHPRKFAQRDRRVDKPLEIDLDFVAPDTVEEMFEALEMLERWTAEAALDNTVFDADPEKKTIRDHRAEGREALEILQDFGRKLLMESPSRLSSLQVLAHGIERSSRPVVVLKPAKAYAAYRELIHVWAVRTLFEYLRSKDWDLEALRDACSEARRQPWVSLGGQLAAQSHLEQMIESIRAGALDSWAAVHEAYRSIAAQDCVERVKYAWAVLCELYGLGEQGPSSAQWQAFLRETAEALHRRAAAVRQTRAKDFNDSFRAMAYESAEEQRAVVGSVEDDSFIRAMEQEAREFEHEVAK